MGRLWLPSLEGAAAGIASTIYGADNAILMGVSAARVLGVIPRALATAVVAVPKQHRSIKRTTCTHEHVVHHRASRVVCHTRSLALTCGKGLPRSTDRQRGDRISVKSQRREAPHGFRPSRSGSTNVDRPANRRRGMKRPPRRLPSVAAPVRRGAQIRMPTQQAIELAAKTPGENFLYWYRAGCTPRRRLVGDGAALAAPGDVTAARACDGADQHPARSGDARLGALSRRSPSQPELRAAPRALT